MFHTVPTYIQPQMSPVHAAADPKQQQSMYSTSHMAPLPGFPVATNDSRSVVYLVLPATPTPAPNPPQSWTQADSSPMLAAAVDSGNPHSSALTRVRSSTTTTTSNANTSRSPQRTPPAASDLRRSPLVWTEGPPPYSGGKLATAASSSSSLQSVALPRPIALSANGVSSTTTNASDMSTTSNVTSFNGNASSTTTHPFFISAAPLPPQKQQTAPGCFWLDSATGTMKAMTTEEVAVAMSANTANCKAAVPAYTMPPPPFPAPTTAAMMTPSDSVTPTAACSIFSASMPGAVPCIPVVAMPPPLPPAPKAMNGLQYEYGEVYGGFVKRYNPNRGFGFLTATYHIKIDSAPSTSASPIDSLTAAQSTNNPAPAVKERRIPVHLGDIFVHQSYMHMQGFRTLPVGGRVRFRVGYKDGQQTFQAVDVELLPQVVPQNMEASATSVASSNTTTASSLPADKPSKGTFVLSTTQSPNRSTPQHPATIDAEFEKVVGSIGSPVSGESHSEAEHFFFSGAKDKGLIRSPLTPTPGTSVNGEDEDDSPLIELAYEVYRSLEG